MATVRSKQEALDLFAAMMRTLVQQSTPIILQNPSFAEVLRSQAETTLRQMLDAIEGPPPPDGGLAGLIGLGDGAAADAGATRVPRDVPTYDDAVGVERISAIADLYYIYQHETVGVLRVVQKLQELFRAGVVRLAEGDGAYALYRFDRREVLRYTARDRLAAYRRALGYGSGPVPAGARANVEFHRLFTTFINQVALYWRDKRVSDVIRERAQDPSFGSVAMVRRAGLDLRHNLKFASFGHVNVLRIEVLQVLEEAFRVLDGPDVRALYGALNAWDVVEEVFLRYFNERIETSPRQGMAIAGRNILQWLAQDHITTPDRTQFEGHLVRVAEAAEEWLSSAESLGLATRRVSNGQLPWNGRPVRSNDARPLARQIELEA